ncbi:MAG: DIP1984 family protein [Oscillospiraceae bacterium]|nr:DIP1984 family protein [Oscillospiraceae bacterium]
MKLAEALQERAALNRQIAQLSARLCANALVQEGESPAEDPAELLVELERCTSRLETLMARINHTNCATLSDGESLTDLLARRDCLNLRLDALRSFTHEASQTVRRARGTEIRILSTMNVKALQKQTDDLSGMLRRLDNRIQAVNWSTELL